MKTSLLQQYLDERHKPLVSCPAQAAVLDKLCCDVPLFCGKALADTATHASQKVQILAGLVRSPITRQAISRSLGTLSDVELLQVLDGLHQHRLNGRRVRELGLCALLGRQRIAELAAAHRLRLVRVLKHLLGERTWASVCRFLELPSPIGERFLHRAVLRFAANPELVREVLCFLAGLGLDPPREPARKPWLVLPWFQQPAQARFEFKPAHPAIKQRLAARRSLEEGEGMAREVLFGLRGTYHTRIPKQHVRRLSAPEPRRGRTDGPLTTALKEALTATGRSASLREMVAATSGTPRPLPLVDVPAAVVLDLSASAVSSGERLHHPAALGLALVGLLEERLNQVTVFQVGGSAPVDGRRIPRPVGPTDLATAVLEAARNAPQVILIVSDGYENCRQGDVAQVVEGLRRLGLAKAVYQVVPVFTPAENLCKRRLGENIPLLRVDHEAAAGELAARLLLAGETDDLRPTTLAAVQELLYGGVP
jgi:hypothetical protein